MSFRIIFKVIIMLNCVIFITPAKSQPSVVITSRTFHPKHEGDSLNTIQIIEELGAERIDWMYENEKRGRLEDITAKVGGVPLKKEINFMTNHANLYPSLAESEVWEKIKERENQINSREHSYIPKTEIQKAEPMLHDGDIVAFTSSVEGLDVNHMGVITKVGSRAYLIHASLAGKKVIISNVPLAEYVASVPKHTGMIVARLTDH